MNRTAHKNFAVNALGAISSSDYDEMNATHESKNAAIRAARAEWENALMNNPAAVEEKAAALDKLLGL